MVRARNSITSAGHFAAARSCVSLRFEDRAAQFDIGGLDIGDEAHRQADEQARLDPVERLRRAVGGEDQPLALGQQRIDRVEQFFLRAGLADDELDIVHQQQVEAAQPRLEFDHLVLACSAWTNSTMKRSAEQ